METLYSLVRKQPILARVHTAMPHSVPCLRALPPLQSMTRPGHTLECTGDISLAAREAQADRGIFGNLVSPRTLDYAHLHPSITLSRPIVPLCRVVPAPCDGAMGRHLLLQLTSHPIVGDVRLRITPPLA